MKIVQLSDIHIGSYFKQDVFDIVVDEINNQLKPDVIVITGDLTDEGLLFQFEQAHAQISRFNCSNIIVLPGNHDYRHTGYLLFKKLFPSSKQIYELNDSVVLLTIGTARPDRDEGEVGYRQNLWVENTLRKYNHKLKVIAMHHHLIGIPDTGTDKIVILDAGDTLRAFLQSKVNLVLCGHKHRPWVWKLAGLEIAYAGTVSSTRFRGFFECSYNIVDIKDGRPQIDIKIVGGKRLPLSDITERYKPQLELD